MDVSVTVYLKKNIQLLKTYCVRVNIIYLPQLLNLEEELARCTDAKTAPELTQSKGNKNFKTDFCMLKVQECRNMLERHHIRVEELWTQTVPADFLFTESNSKFVKEV